MVVQHVVDYRAIVDIDHVCSLQLHRLWVWIPELPLNCNYHIIRAACYNLSSHPHTCSYIRTSGENIGLIDNSVAH